MGSLMEDKTLHLEQSRIDGVSEILLDAASEHKRNLRAYRLC